MALTISITNKDLERNTNANTGLNKVHTQRIERSIKIVIQAAGHVYNHETRKGYFKVQPKSRQMMKRNNNKNEMKASAILK